MVGRETYASQLRTEQAQTTRLRILEAAARLMARPVVDFSIPAIAGEAAVAIATIYRNFKTKQELIDGLLDHYSGQLAAAAGLTLGDAPVTPAGPDEIYPMVAAAFERLATIDSTFQAAFATQIADEARRGRRGERIRRVEAWLESITAGMEARDRRRLVDLAVVLGSSATLRSFDVLVGASPAQAADVVAWAIRRLALPYAND